MSFNLKGTLHYVFCCGTQDNRLVIGTEEIYCVPVSTQMHIGMPF